MISQIKQLDVLAPELNFRDCGLLSGDRQVAADHRTSHRVVVLRLTRICTTNDGYPVDHASRCQNSLPASAFFLIADGEMNVGSAI